MTFGVNKDVNYNKPKIITVVVAGTLATEQ